MNVCVSLDVPKKLGNKIFLFLFHPLPYKNVCLDAIIKIIHLDVEERGETANPEVFIRNSKKNSALFIYLLTSPKAMGLSKPAASCGLGEDLEDDDVHEAGIEGIDKEGNDLDEEKHLQ